MRPYGVARNPVLSTDFSDLINDLPVPAMGRESMADDGLLPTLDELLKAVRAIAKLKVLKRSWSQSHRRYLRSRSRVPELVRCSSETKIPEENSGNESEHDVDSTVRSFSEVAENVFELSVDEPSPEPIRNSRKLKASKLSRRRHLRFRFRGRPAYCVPNLIARSRRSSEGGDSDESLGNNVLGSFEELDESQVHHFLEPVSEKTFEILEETAESRDEILLETDLDGSFESFCEFSEFDARCAIPPGAELEEIFRSLNEVTWAKDLWKNPPWNHPKKTETVDSRSVPDVTSIFGTADEAAERRVRQLLSRPSPKGFQMPELLPKPVILAGELVDTDPSKVTVPPGFPFKVWVPPMPKSRLPPQEDVDYYHENYEDPPYGSDFYPQFTAPFDPNFVHFENPKFGNPWVPPAHDFIEPPSGTVYFMPKSQIVNNSPCGDSFYAPECYDEEPYFVNNSYNDHHQYNHQFPYC